MEENSADEPQILIVGDCLNRQQVFVIADGKGLERSSLIEAADTCFKMFYVMDIQYPWQCSVTWEFFQKVVYCLEDKHKRETTPAVISVRGALRASDN